MAAAVRRAVLVKWKRAFMVREKGQLAFQLASCGVNGCDGATGGNNCRLTLNVTPDGVERFESLRGGPSRHRPSYTFSTMPRRYSSVRMPSQTSTKLSAKAKEAACGGSQEA